LRRTIDNNGIIGRHGAQKPFYITPEELLRIGISEAPVPVSVFVKTVNDALGDLERKKLAATTITGWLVKEGYLKEQETEPGKHRKVPAEASASIGISSEQREGARGAYDIILYNKDAQRFLLDNLKNIL
jgi:hypothetical protein